MRYIIVRGELLLYTPVVDIDNRIPPPCVFATQDSTRKDSTQTFNIKSLDHELAHIRAREVQTYTIMANNINDTVQNAAQVASTNENQAQTLVEDTENQAQTLVEDTENKIPEGTVKKFALAITRVQLYDDTDIASVWLTFKKAIPGFALKDNDYVPCEVNAISFSRSSLTRTLCENDDMIATMRDGQNDPFTRAQLSTILHGAMLNVTRTFHRTGYTREDGSAIDRDQWFTEITKVNLTDFAKKLIEKLVMQRMLQD